MRPRETHCLVGENGCGKSTLIKILAGVHAPDSGEIRVGDQGHQRLHPGEAIRHGFEVIFQDFSLFPNLTVAENIAFPTHLRDRRRFVGSARSQRIAAAALAKLGVSLDLEERVASLSVARQQLVAIARALREGTQLLIMDEPTAALTRHEIERLFEVVRKLKHQGVGILLVSHKTTEILEMADHITVLRNGEVVQSGPVRLFTPASMVAAMTGRPESTCDPAPAPGRPSSIPRLRVDHLRRRGQPHAVSFEVQPGEIIGLTGRLGAGRTELARALFGLARVDQGAIEVDGQPVRSGSPQAAVTAGIAYVPEDRLREGLFPDQSVGRNLLAGLIPSLGGRVGWIKPGEIHAQALAWIERLRIRTPDAWTPIGNLSGGNQQKVVLARWLACEAKILLLNRPTTGVDVAAKAEIHQRLREWAARGVSILLISDDPPELLGLAHRLLVFDEGRIAGEWPVGTLEVTALAARLESL